MESNHCTQWGILYLAWVMTPATEPKLREAKKAAYMQHLNDCPVCHAAQLAIVEQSKTAVHPELAEIKA